MPEVLGIYYQSTNIQQKLTLKRQKIASKETSAKPNETRQGEAQVLPMNMDATQTTTSEQMAKDIASIYALLKATSETQESKLSTFQTAMGAVETKLADMAAWLTNAESHIDFLEDANRTLEENLLAT